VLSCQTLSGFTTGSFSFGVRLDLTAPRLVGSFTTSPIWSKLNYLPIECGSLDFEDATSIIPTVEYAIGNATHGNSTAVIANLVPFRPAAGVGLLAISLVDGGSYTIYCRATNAVNLSTTVSFTLTVHAAPPKPLVADPAAFLVFLDTTYLGATVLPNVSVPVAACAEAASSLSVRWNAFTADSQLASITANLYSLWPERTLLESAVLGASSSVFTFTQLSNYSSLTSDAYLAVELKATSVSDLSTLIQGVTLLRVPLSRAPSSTGLPLLAGNDAETFGARLATGSRIYVQWLNAFHGGVYDVSWAIGTTPGEQQIQLWTSVPLDACAQQTALLSESTTDWPLQLPLCGVLTGLSLLPNVDYYVSVRAASCTSRSAVLSSAALRWDTIPVGVTLASTDMSSSTWASDSPFSVDANYTYATTEPVLVVSNANSVQLTLCCLDDPQQRAFQQEIALKRTFILSPNDTGLVPSTFIYDSVTGALSIQTRQRLRDGLSYTATVKVTTVSGAVTTLSRPFLVDLLGPTPPATGITVSPVPALLDSFVHRPPSWCQASLSEMFIEWDAFISRSPILKYQVCVQTAVPALGAQMPSVPCDVLLDTLDEQGRSVHATGLALQSGAAYTVTVTVSECSKLECTVQTLQAAGICSNRH
jgi:hypothetical protein